MNSIRHYLFIIKKYAHLVGILFILQPIAIYIDTGPISYIYKDVVNKLNTPTPALYTHVFELIAYYSIILICWRIIGYVIVVFESQAKRDLEQHVFGHIISQSYKFHVNRFSGSLVAQTNRFVNAFERLFDTVYFELYRIGLYMIFSVIVMTTINIHIAILTLCWAIFFVATNIFFQYKKAYLSSLAASLDSKVTARLADSLSNIFTVKTFAKENTEQYSFNTASNERALAVKKDWFAAELIFAWQALVMLTFEIYLLKLSIDLSIAQAINVGQIVQIQILIFPLMRNLWNLGKVIRNIERGVSDSVEMAHILDHKPTIIDKHGAKSPHITSGTIVCSNVSFGYDKKLITDIDEPNDDEGLFSNFNITIPSGQKVGLVGKSGSGKTTLTKLLMRLMDIQSGSITIDGHNIQSITQKSIRDAISYVPQEPNLFHRTLRENITYGKEVTDEVVIDASKKAEAHTFIEKLQKGYDTLVGERGTKLSGGERQRVAIARAIIKDAPIVILDEATSALDSESEQAIQKALEQVMIGKTAIIIAHRLSTIQKLDRIVVLDNGQIVEDGTHTELLAKNGTYAQLWKHQSGGFMGE